MATQGLITLRQGGKVVAKIIAGQNGHRVANFQRKDVESLTPESLYQLACSMGLSGLSLVIQTGPGRCYTANGHETLDQLYDSVDGFENAMFNPRWKTGTADYTLVVDLLPTVLTSADVLNAVKACDVHDLASTVLPMVQQFCAQYDALLDLAVSAQRYIDVCVADSDTNPAMQQAWHDYNLQHELTRRLLPCGRTLA